MKVFLSLAVILMSFQASANVQRRSCNFQDFRIVESSLRNENIVAGEELKNEILDVLFLEIGGPRCVEVIQTSPGVSIPGNKYKRYELLLNSGAVYGITLIQTFDNKKTVRITKK